MHKLPKRIEFARALRKRQTPEEEIMWSHLRNRKLGGYKFLRQFPVVIPEGFFIADFYCAEKKLVVEIDGGIHRYQQEYDRYRDEVMKSMGMVVIRITNEEVNGDVYGVLRRIKNVGWLNKRGLDSPPIP
ncbi:MAG: endonuclease domain-containing protein [Chitinophagaceae bacterium]